MDVQYASKGQANLNTVLGAIGTAGAVGILNGGLGGLFGGMNAPAQAAAAANMCHENQAITRYDMSLIKDNMAKDSEIALLKADKYTDQKFADLNDRYSDRFRNIESELARQAIHNQKTEDSFLLARQDLATVKAQLEGQIAMEAERRCCADNAIVTYANATFYPKMVAEVTVGTTTTAQTLYNPIPKCGCCGGNGAG